MLTKRILFKTNTSLFSPLFYLLLSTELKSHKNNSPRRDMFKVQELPLPTTVKCRQVHATTLSIPTAKSGIKKNLQEGVSFVQKMRRWLPRLS